MACAAYTPASGYRHYPPFINLSVRGGDMVVIARGTEREFRDYVDSGYGIQFDIPLEDAEALLEAALAEVRTARAS